MVRNLSSLDLRSELPLTVPQGHNINLRCISSILYPRPSLHRVDVGHLMDRKRASVSSGLHRSLCWAVVRHGLDPTDGILWVVPHGVRHVYDQHFTFLLSSLLGPGCMCRLWFRPDLCADSRGSIQIFYDQATHCNRSRSRGFECRRRDIPDYVSKAPAANWIWLDGAVSIIYQLGLRRHCLYHSQRTCWSDAASTIVD